MSEGNPNREGFAARWSRRKLNPAVAEPARITEAAPAKTSAAESFADFDFSSLDFNSDYRRFMAGPVSDAVRNTALQKLWSSSDLIAKPDELDDYLEDFREEAMALPADLARSAYRAGRGLFDEPEEQVAIDTSLDTSPSKPTTEEPEFLRPDAGVTAGGNASQPATPEKSKS